MKKIIIALVCIIVFSLIINYYIHSFNVIFGDNGISESLGLSSWQTFFFNYCLQYYLYYYLFIV